MCVCVRARAIYVVYLLTFSREMVCAGEKWLQQQEGAETDLAVLTVNATIMRELPAMSSLFDWLLLKIASPRSFWQLLSEKERYVPCSLLGAAAKNIQWTYTLVN